MMNKDIERQPGKTVTQENAFISDLKSIAGEARRQAYRAADQVMVVRNWLIGRCIVEQEQHGRERAEYGKHVMELASQALTKEYGKGFGITTIRNMRQFYLTFKNLRIHKALLGEFETGEFPIHQALLGESGEGQGESAVPLYPNLSWLHYERAMRVKDETARLWYLKEASAEQWDYRTLQRNISSQYYYRLLQTPEESRHEVSEEMRRMLGDFYIDLVFYNIMLKSYLLIDLKTTQITHQDVGQMDMYIRMYDELKAEEGNNPTIGLLLCADTSKDLARYSMLKDSKQLFAAKYLTYLPSKEELAREIREQKEIFELQTGKQTDK